MIKEIPEKDRAYFAGLFDGEGTVRIYKHIRKDGNGNAEYGLRVSFGLTYKPVLLRMQKYFSGNVHTVNKDTMENTPSALKGSAAGTISPEKWKQRYDYYLTGRDALYFLKVIKPFCDEKQQQAELAIQFEQGRRDGRGTGRSDRETERCEFYYQEIMKLKYIEYSEENNEISLGFEDEQQSIFKFVEGV